ncbi:MAG: tetratricopeptide repeat protein [Candidatus Omnitrophica bacterium]|nr:tetratricopeptide repeat protein [Candidatus Omnitrophota bacterium]
MLIKKMQSVFVFCRVAVLYLVLVAGFLYCTNYKEVFRVAGLQTLSRLEPSYNYRKVIMDHPETPDRQALEDCRYYHRQVADLVPPSSGEAWAMVGVCSYGLGREDEALKAFQRSLKKTPVFFWTYYNLGVFWFNKGDFMKAGDFFAKAGQLDPKYSMTVFGRSKVFADIYLSFGGQDFDLEQSLAGGYRQAANMVKMCIACFHSPQAPFCQKKSKLYMRVF